MLAICHLNLRKAQYHRAIGFQYHWCIYRISIGRGPGEAAQRYGQLLPCAFAAFGQGIGDVELTVTIIAAAKAP